MGIETNIAWERMLAVCICKCTSLGNRLKQLVMHTWWYLVCLFGMVTNMRER